ncbi:MAG: DUF6152 family protein, partial [Gammaproteobacteria bacterium]|nr:DUF6152 family protein [Gammaproteobacteria bacterium]
SFAAHFLMDRFAEVEGRITEVDWVNPHIRIFVEDDAGDVWEVEAGPVNLLSRMGIARETFEVGSTIRARGNPGRRDDRVLWVANILLADNTEILAAPGSEPYWGSNAVGDASVFFEAPELSLPENGQRSFFRIWSPLISQFPRPRGDAVLTATGQAAQARYGIDNQAVADCEVPGMPFAMMSPYPIQLIERDDHILIRGEAYDLERIAWLEPLDAIPDPSPQGYSLATIEGDTLVIETTQIDYHSYGDLGPAQSDQSHVVERFTLSADGTELDYEVTVTDQVMLAEPWLWGGGFVLRDDAELRAWNCGVG